MDETLEPALFFASIRLRELMFRAARPVRSIALARYLKIDRANIVEQLGALVQAGLVVETSRSSFRLTDEGEASIRWSAPPPPDGRITTRWVTELVRAAADHYEVSVSEVLRSEVGAGVLARARLCFALYARGWSIDRIDEHFALPPGWSRRAVERWKRLRDQVIPKTGPELRAWRERLGLTQRQAAARLGVSRLTIVRAERAVTFSSRMALGRS